MIDRLIKEYVEASDEERKAFNERIGHCGVSAEDVEKAVNTMSEIARNI